MIPVTLIPRNLRAMPVGPVLFILNSRLTSHHPIELVVNVFTHCSSLFRVATAALDTQAAQFDIDAAYRRIPTIFEHWKFLVVSIQNNETGIVEYFIDMAHPFGLKSAGGNLGYAMDATIVILKHLLDIVFIAKWVDDLVIVRHPSHAANGQPQYN